MSLHEGMDTRLRCARCYEHAALAERKFTLQSSGLVRTVWPCAQRRVALMPRAMSTARDALSNDRRGVSKGLHAKQVLVLATEPRAK